MVLTYTRLGYQLALCEAVPGDAPRSHPPPGTQAPPTKPIPWWLGVSSNTGFDNNKELNHIIAVVVIVFLDIASH